VASVLVTPCRTVQVAGATTSSSGADTLCVWGTFQFAAVKVRVGAVRVHPVAVDVTVTSAVGCEPRTIVYVSPGPPSVSCSAVVDSLTAARSSSTTGPPASGTLSAA
jgi:hypothetical protein